MLELRGEEESLCARAKVALCGKAERRPFVPGLRGGPLCQDREVCAETERRRSESSLRGGPLCLGRGEALCAET